MNQYLQQIIDQPGASFGILANIILIECVLSVDNAAVLATMVSDLPKEQRKKALRYGIFGAYFFRGLCLLFAGLLVQFWQLKVIGGGYLLWLVFTYFRPKGEEAEETEPTSVWGKILNALGGFKDSIFNKTLGLFGTFWATVALVEMMDLAFSVDNVFAVVAMTPNLLLVYVGVFIGILGMRYVAQAFVWLMGRFPFLETAAHVLIGILGIKLVLAWFEHYNPKHGVSVFLGSQEADWALTIITAAVFGIPIMIRLVMDARKSKKAQIEAEEQAA